MADDGLSKLNLEAYLGDSGSAQELLSSLGISAIPPATNLGMDHNSGLAFDPTNASEAALFIAQQVAAINQPPPRKMSSTEKTRTENRERKKRWREQNEERNKDNDLRCRVNKRAHKLFGTDPSPEKSAWIEAEFYKRQAKRREKERQCANQNNNNNNVLGRNMQNNLLGDLGLLSTNQAAAALRGNAINNALNVLAKDPDLINNLLGQIDLDPTKTDLLGLGAMPPPLPPQPEHELAALQEHNEAHDAAMRQYELQRQQQDGVLLPGLAGLDSLQALQQLDFTDPTVALQAHAQASFQDLLSQPDSTASLFSALSSGTGDSPGVPDALVDPLGAGREFSLPPVLPLDLLAPATSVDVSQVSSPASDSHLDLSLPPSATIDSTLPVRPRNYKRDSYRMLPYYNKRNTDSALSSPYDALSPKSPNLDVTLQGLSRPQTPSAQSVNGVTGSSLVDVSLTASLTNFTTSMPPNAHSSQSFSNRPDIQKKAHALGFPPMPGNKIEFQRTSSVSSSAADGK
ncbi:transcriptional regulatory protein Spp41 [Schizosaccharomyces japonicus yFS275]|uniref:Transcriptional regulatory protein Spp41 n=1 Tax=Schizosaccharomyces japonicus (strain yFS275 / FY16936) TaxID=402676 RepID=B6K5W0_SCHJY|nr:transcriptional regulatory protein Spp41 [Schizosaccharomyces japonicus yFS275]EEB08914.1 transcriptional regulatory protein Spp41 [Schizosaccharomyces japonicus yFS275]